MFTYKKLINNKNIIIFIKFTLNFSYKNLEI